MISRNTIIIILLLGLFISGIGLGILSYASTINRLEAAENTSCNEAHERWEFLHNEFIPVISESITYPPTENIDLQTAQEIANKAREVRQNYLLKKLGNAPVC